MTFYRRDPRQFVRIPMSGVMLWRSGLGAGKGEILDMSPTGAAIRVPISEAFQIGPSVMLDIGLGAGATCRLADDAVIAYKIPSGDGTCRIGVRFPPLHGDARPGDVSLAPTTTDMERALG
jgi:hypothetical protein